MKTLLILAGILAVQTSFANDCENRERFRGPNVAFGITFWHSIPESAEGLEKCIQSAQAQLGRFIEDCDSTADWPQGCTVYAAEYRYTNADGSVIIGKVR